MAAETPEDRLHKALFSTQGIVDSVVGPLVFLVLYRLWGLNAGLIGAGAVALAVVAIRRARGEQLTSAWYGVSGVLIGAVLAKVIGSSDGFFLPRVAVNAVSVAIAVGSVVVGRPLVGIVWAMFHRQPLPWGYRPEVRRVFGWLTLLWAAGYALRAIVIGGLIADDEDRTGALAVASVALGLPLTAVLFAVTILVIRRSLGPLARPEPAAQLPV